MRNDANDDFDDVPSLRADPLDDDVFPTTSAARERTSVHSRGTPVVKVKSPSTGPLWALVGALFFAFIGLAWWSFQQISLMEQQLVATQESFARISEEAAGRLQDISGKVVASQTNVTTDSEALKLQIKQLESRLQDQSRQQQGVAGQATDLDKRLAQMSAQNAEQQAANSQLQAQVKALSGELASLKSAQTDNGKVDAQLKSLGADLATLKKQGNPSAAIERLEQDLIVLKSQQDNRPAAAQNGASTAEFDAFRGQVTRNINTLQSQIQNLQQQINTRP
ncbi:chromosome segregation ATPase [Pseudomonas protegens]|jgi:chromosome segregation ATPase|uniref:ATPase n=1 Tax=Pseudomonas TaxID=286 RepID=UPI000F4AE475|nr:MULTISPECIES: ATPase [Pseudomonas]MDT3421239.1 chromosome segregation ATPase [Pseudomonas protegens]ROM26955.1 ATPase [Pseudomonas protegens]BCQ70928.1 ATPase [Pseudomonas sp. Eqa60]